MTDVTIIKMSPDNFIPLKKTPWAGNKVTDIKTKYHAKLGRFPDLRIGEAWEISSDNSYPSRISYPPQIAGQFLPGFLNSSKQNILGKKFSQKFGSFWCPLLLKWLEAKEVLSVQLHPKNGDPLLQDGECGKPEAWFVMDVEPNAFVYLGFKSGLSRLEIERLILEDKPELYLEKFYPKKFDYIAVPPGCVHAVGPGVLVAEPQYVLPQKSGKTWRLSDWGRKFTASGDRDDQHGNSRELHTTQALGAIDWNLPSGKALQDLLVSNITHGQSFLGNSFNPFALRVFASRGSIELEPFFEDQFSALTMVSGEAKFNDPSTHSFVSLLAGESALVPAHDSNFIFSLVEALNDEPLMLEFALNSVYLEG